MSSVAIRQWMASAQKVCWRYSRNCHCEPMDINAVEMKKNSEEEDACRPLLAEAVTVAHIQCSISPKIMLEIAQRLSLRPNGTQTLRELKTDPKRKMLVEHSWMAETVANVECSYPPVAIITPKSMLKITQKLALRPNGT